MLKMLRKFILRKFDLIEQAPPPKSSNLGDVEIARVYIFKGRAEEGEFNELLELYLKDQLSAFGNILVDAYENPETLEHPEIFLNNITEANRAGYSDGIMATVLYATNDHPTELRTWINRETGVIENES